MGKKYIYYLFSVQPRGPTAKLQIRAPPFSLYTRREALCGPRLYLHVVAVFEAG